MNLTNQLVKYFAQLEIMTSNKSIIRLVTKGQYIPLCRNNRDFIPDAPSVTVLSGSDTKQVYNCFFKETDIFNVKDSLSHDNGT